MPTTKRQLIDQAYEDIGIASYEFDVTSNELASALRKLDMMMAQWDSIGVRLGYALPSSPESSLLTSDSGTPDVAHAAIVLNLAIRLAPSFGKAVTPELKMVAREAWDALLLWVYSRPIEMQLPSNLIVGAGNRRYGHESPFFQAPPDDLTLNQDAVLELLP